jgi:hypothetical protein
MKVIVKQADGRMSMAEVEAPEGELPVEIVQTYSSALDIENVVERRFEHRDWASQHDGPSIPVYEEVTS